jgi:hypothetical protein
MIFSSNDLEGPLQERCTTGEACSDGREQNGIALLHFSFGHGRHHRERDGPGRRVSETIDVDNDFFERHLQALGGRHDDSAIRLVSDEAIDVSAGLAILFENALGHLRHFLDGIFEDLRAILMNHVHVLRHGFCRGWVQRTASGHVEILATHAFDLMNVIEDAEIFAFFCGLKQHGTSSVAEDDAGVAILVVDHRRIDVRTDDENFLVDAAFDELGAGRQRVNESAASGGDIEAPAVSDLEFVLNQAGSGRIHHVGSYGSDNDGLNVADVRAVTFDKILDGIDGQVAGRNAFFDDMTFADTGPCEDPVVGRLYHLLQLEIIEYLGRDISAESSDLGTSKRFQLRRSPVVGIEHCLPLDALL